MSIANQIAALTSDKTAIESAITNKGGTLSQNSGFDTYATDIATIPSGGGVDINTLVDGSIKNISTNATTIKIGAFMYCSRLTNVIANNATDIRDNAFQNCSNLLSISLLRTTRIDQSAFFGCSKIENMCFPSLTMLIGNWLFSSCNAFHKIIIGSPSLVTLPNTNCFNNTPFAANGTGGIAYVLRNLISSYEGATNWSALNCTFKPIDTETLSGDGSTTTFTLTATTDEVFYVKIGSDFPEYTYDDTTGTITFTTAPASGTDNITVYHKGADNI